MNNGKKGITAREIIFIVGAVFVFFEIYLMKYVNALRYVDELIAVLCLAKILIAVFRKGLDRNHIYMLMLMVLVLAIGLVSNYFAGIQTLSKPIIMDIGNCFKVFVTYVGASLYLKPVKSKKRIISSLAFVMRCFVVLLFGCMILSYVGVLDMGGDNRYGIESFYFINDGAGQLSFLFYSIIMVLTLDQKYPSQWRQMKLVFIAMALVVWTSTLRTRAFIYVVAYIALYWALIVKKIKIELNWKTVLLAIIVLYIFSADQIDMYFSNPKTARAYFARFGSYTMERYFPFGSGFATYGTDAAVVYYSRLYWQYRFYQVWGLNPLNPIFTHDTYWPAIMAQFGFFGLVAMVLVVVFWVRDVAKKSAVNPYAYLVGLFICMTQLSASIATATFFHFVTVAVMFMLPLAFDEDTSFERRNSDEESDSIHPDLQPSPGPAPGV